MYIRVIHFHYIFFNSYLLSVDHIWRVTSMFIYIFFTVLAVLNDDKFQIKECNSNFNTNESVE